MCVPKIEIADLWSFDADDPEEMAGRHFQCRSVAWRDDNLVDRRQALSRPLVERCIEGGYPIDGVANHRCRLPTPLRVSGSDRLGHSSHWAVPLICRTAQHTGARWQWRKSLPH